MQVNLSPVRLLFGTSREHVGNALMASVLCLFYLHVLQHFSTAFAVLSPLLLFLPLSVWIGYADAGLISAWVLIVLPVGIAWPGWCELGAAFCPPSAVPAKLLFGFQTALAVGTIGYVLGRAFAAYRRRTDDEPSSEQYEASDPTAEQYDDTDSSW